MSGILGRLSLAANSYNKLYTVPDDIVATFNINVVNRANESATLRLAISQGDTEPSDADFFEYGTELNTLGSVLERTALTASAGESVFIYSTSENVSACVYGFEEHQ